MLDKIIELLGNVELNTDNGIFYIDEKFYDQILSDFNIEDRKIAIDKCEKSIFLLNDCKTADELNHLLSLDYETEIWGISV